MTLLVLGQPSLPPAGLLGPILLAVALSAAANVAAVAAVVRSRSRETNEPQRVLLTRIYGQVMQIVARARGRWRIGAVRAVWHTDRRRILRTVGLVLGAETLGVLGVATSDTNYLTVFAATLMVVACLLANAAMGLLWLAGPADQACEPLYANNGKKVTVAWRVPFAGFRRIDPPQAAAILPDGQAEENRK